MRHLKQQKAFTIIELLVVIIIVAILIIGTMRINLTRLTVRQQVGIEVTKLTSLIETVKNNAQSGKAVGEDIEIPELWKIEINSSNGGEVYSYAEINGSIIHDSKSTWSSTSNRRITLLECHNFDSSNISSLTGTGTITFEGSGITFSNTNCGANQKVLFINYGYDNIIQGFRFNNLSGVIEKSE